MNRNIEELLTRQASDWFVKYHDGSMSERERASFVEWLRASPLHVREYLEVATLARDLRTAADDPALEIDRLMAEASKDADSEVIPMWSATGQMRPKTSSRRVLLGLVAAIGIAGVVVAWHWLASDVLSTVHGEQRVWRLDDGSIVHLNSESHVKLSFAETARQVDVVRGQVLFNVARDPHRPFRVTAGQLAVVAVGTSFDVYRKADETLVTVVEGVVKVQQGAELRPVTAGEQFRTSAPGQAPITNPVDVQQAVAWTQQQIIFDEERLGDVTAEFNRYGSKPILIEDAALRDLRVSGVFNAYDTESFLAFIDKLHGVKVEVRDDQVRVATQEPT